jgi:hypothetical protein
LILLQELALAMQDHTEGRQSQVSRGWAAQRLLGRFQGADETEQCERAGEFLEQEEVDSGIIVSRGGEIRFWHLTFQEYLAARAIGGKADKVQHQLVLANNKIYNPEWREVILLLGGVLLRQGAAKVDGLIAAALDKLGAEPTLSEKALFVGLFGAVTRDLRVLAYEPVDYRYAQMFDAVLDIFDAKKAGGVEFKLRVEAAEALGRAGDPRLSADNWVRIESGEFWMGAQAGEPAQRNYDPIARQDEGPVRLINLPSYQIGRYPVTVSEYQQFVEGNSYLDDRWWSAGGFGEKKEPSDWQNQLRYPNRPVTDVNWYEAAAYCKWGEYAYPRRQNGNEQRVALLQEISVGLGRARSFSRQP